MKAEVVYTDFVKNDLTEISQWYTKIDKKIWNSFTKEFRSKINFIRENPLSFEQKYDYNRVAFLKKFPYGIHYIYNKEKNLIEIYSVFHTSRDPDSWKTEK